MRATVVPVLLFLVGCPEPEPEPDSDTDEATDTVERTVVDGRIVDEDGNGLANVYVNMCSIACSTVSTDDTGAFTYGDGLVADAYSLHVEPDDAPTLTDPHVPLTVEHHCMLGPRARLAPSSSPMRRRARPRK